MKKLMFFLLLVNFSNVKSQSELLIPKEAITVFSINNINLLQKISVDELIQYEFMEEVHQELFDGSTSEKTLKDAGIDFNQRLNVFYGKNNDYELSGFTFGVSDLTNLFEVFDDFEELQSKYDNTKLYGSFFNNLIIKNNAALLIRFEPSYELVNRKTDSIWYSRGNLPPFDFNEEAFNEEVFETEDSTYLEPIIYDQEELPIEIDDPNEKNYNELRDSVQITLQEALLTNLLDALFIDNLNLVKSDTRFSEQFTHPCEATFYFDNSRSFKTANGLWYFQTIMPSIYKDLQELYTGNIILGDLFLKEK